MFKPKNIRRNLNAEVFKSVMFVLVRKYFLILSDSQFKTDWKDCK